VVFWFLFCWFLFWLFFVFFFFWFVLSVVSLWVLVGALGWGSLLRLAFWGFAFGFCGFVGGCACVCCGSLYGCGFLCSFGFWVVFGLCLFLFVWVGLLGGLVWFLSGGVLGGFWVLKFLLVLEPEPFPELFFLPLLPLVSLNRLAYPETSEIGPRVRLPSIYLFCTGFLNLNFSPTFLSTCPNTASSLHLMPPTLFCLFFNMSFLSFCVRYL